MNKSVILMISKLLTRYLQYARSKVWAIGHQYFPKAGVTPAQARRPLKCALLPENRLETRLPLKSRANIAIEAVVGPLAGSQQSVDTGVMEKPAGRRQGCRRR